MQNAGSRFFEGSQRFIGRRLFNFIAARPGRLFSYQLLETNKLNSLVVFYGFDQLIVRNADVFCMGKQLILQ